MTVVVQVEDNDSVAKDVASGGGEKSVDFRYILGTELTEFLMD